MALINITDKDRDRINKLVLAYKQKFPDLKINQSYIVSQGLDFLEDLK
jgi:hypothetical protein